MKVAILSSGFLPVVDGVTVTLLYRLRHLSQLGHQVLLLCPSYAALQSIYPDWETYIGNFLPGVRIVSLPSTAFMGVNFERNVSGRSYTQVLQELDQFQPEVIHVDEPDRLFLGFGKIPAVAYARRHRVPCIGFYHTNFLEYMDDYLSLPQPILGLLKDLCRRFITCRVFNAYDQTLTSSPITHQNVVKIGIRNAIYKEVLGVDLEKFTPTLRQDQFFEQQYGLHSVADRIKLVFVGRLTPDKGWKFTLRAIPQLLQRIDPNRISLIIVGDGELRQTIATTLEDKVDVHFLGRVSPDGVPAIFANSDIHITSSEKETKGLTILEAFATGIPALAPSAGGVIDTIQHEWNGLLYRPGDLDDWATQLQRLIQDGELRQRLGQNGLNWVQFHGWNQAVHRLVKVWEHLVAA